MSSTRFTAYRMQEFNSEDWDKNIRPCGMNDLLAVKPKPFTDKQITAMQHLIRHQGYKYLMVFDEEKLQTIAIALPLTEKETAQK